MKHGALQHSLETQRRLYVAVLAGGQPRRGLIYELLEFRFQFGGVRAAGFQDLPDLGCVHDGEQQMLHRHEFMPRLARTGKRIVQAKL